MNMPPSSSFPSHIPMQHGMAQQYPGDPLKQYPEGVQHALAQGRSKMWDPQLALWTLNKGQTKMWADIQPQQQHVSLQSLREELAKKQRRTVPSVHHTYNQIKSDNARAAIDRLVEEANSTLWAYNHTLQWKIVGIELQHRKYADLFHRAVPVLRSIDVLLQTENRPLAQPRPVMNVNTENIFNDNHLHDFVRPMTMPINPYGPPVFDGTKSWNRGFVPQFEHHIPGAPKHTEPFPVQDKGLPPPMDGRPPPPPPPPPGPFTGQGNMTPRLQPLKDNKPAKIPVGPGQQENGRPSVVNIINPGSKQNGSGATKVKNSKPQPFRGPEYFSDIDQESDCDGSLTGESVEDGFHNVVRGRSRTRHHNETMSRGLSSHGSLSRSRTGKPYINTKSSVQAQSTLERPPMGTAKDVSVPRSSNSSLPPNINIHVTGSTSNKKPDKAKRGWDGGHHGYHPHRHREEGNRPRSQSSDRQRYVHELKTQFKSRSPSPFVWSSHRPSTPMSPGYSSYESDPVFSETDSADSWTSDDNMFAEDTHRNYKNHRPKGSLHDPPPHPADRYHKSTRVNDYPPSLPRATRPIYNYKRPAAHHPTGHAHFNEDDASITAWPPTSRRHHYQSPNPFNVRYAHHPAYQHDSYREDTTYAPKGMVSNAPYGMYEIVEATVEALHAKKANAFNHTQQSHRRAPRRVYTENTYRDW